jgi:dihydrofolate reductase
MLVISVQMSADGSIGPDIGWFDGEQEHDAAEDELRLADAMLLGRKTYAALAPIWSATPGAFAERVNGMPKHVGTTTLTGPLDWNASIVKGDLADEVRRLKVEQRLLTYGCGEFAYELVRLGLVDEIHFWVHPVVWAEQHRPFHGLGHIRMTLKDTTAFRSGVVRNKYVPA